MLGEAVNIDGGTTDGVDGNSGAGIAGRRTGGVACATGGIAGLATEGGAASADDIRSTIPLRQIGQNQAPTVQASLDLRNGAPAGPRCWSAAVACVGLLLLVVHGDASVGCADRGVRALAKGGVMRLHIMGGSDNG